jgi:Tol biopolymer transport system component
MTTRHPLRSLLPVLVVGILTLSSCGNEGDPQPPSDLTTQPRIVFVRTEDGNADIYAMDADGGNVEQLTSGSAQDQSPEWSPDGARIAFESDRAGNHDIYVMDADGSDARQLTTGAGRDSYPAWSPDGRLILYNRENANFGIALYSMQADGTHQKPFLSLDNSTLNADWSPDGTEIVFESGSDIYIADADGSNPHRITDGSSYNLGPSWSPDGTRVAYSRGEDTGEPLDVFVTSADGKHTEQLTHDAALGSPDWSPDGSLLVISGFTNQQDAGFIGDSIYLMRSDGSDLNQIASTEGVSYSSPDWAAD